MLLTRSIITSTRYSVIAPTRITRNTAGPCVRAPQLNTRNTRGRRDGDLCLASHCNRDITVPPTFRALPSVKDSRPLIPNAEANERNGRPGYPPTRVILSILSILSVAS